MYVHCTYLIFQKIPAVIKTCLHAPKYCIWWKAICCFRSYGFFEWFFISLPPPPKKKNKKKERKDHLPWQCHVLWCRLFVPQFLQHCKGKVSYIATQWFCGDWLLQDHCWFELAWISVHHQSPVSHRKPTSDAPYSIGCKKMGFAIKYPQRRHKVLSEITVKKHHKCHV